MTLDLGPSSTHINAELVLVFGADPWPMGCLMTKAAYCAFIALCSHAERVCHTQCLIDSETAYSLGYEFIGSIEVKLAYKLTGTA